MRTVLTVDTLGETNPITGAEVLMVKAERANVEPPDARKFKRLDLSAQQLPDWAKPAGVQARGKAVRQALCTHPAVQTILEHLALAPSGQVQPLFLKLAGGDAEMIPWETLCDVDGEFLALDQRWPIGRVCDPLQGESRPPPVLSLPVRLLVVISAYGIPTQKQEWAALARAVQEARAAGLPMHLRVLVADDSTYQAVQASMAAGLADVQLSGIEKTSSRVVQDIVAWAPNIVHFFCHGHAGSSPSDQSLELATKADITAQAGAGSVRIRTRQLTDMLVALPNPWLVTLNCCASAAASSELLSLAHQVVSAGFPAAVAMIEPVDASDAHEFTRSFYRCLFADLAHAAQQLQQPGAGSGPPSGAQKRVPFEFTRAMHEARSAVCDLHGGDSQNARQWVLPVLYVRGVASMQFEAPFEAQPAAPQGQADEHALRAKIIADWLRQVRESLDEAGRLEVMQSALAGVPPRYWPDVNGQFGGAP